MIRIYKVCLLNKNWIHFLLLSTNPAFLFLFHQWCVHSFFSCKGWCLCDFLLPLIHLPFLIKCSLCWKIKVDRFLWFSFLLPVARSKGQLMYGIICLLFPSWSMKNQRANLYSCATRNIIMEIYLTWSNVRQVISKGSVPHCYKKSTRNFYVPRISALFCICNTWKCLGFQLVPFFLLSLLIKEKKAVWWKCKCFYNLHILA